MADHDQILAAAQRIAASRPDWTFTADEIVRALPHVNAQTVRTHVTSRCCVNAPAHHQSRPEYFRRIARGRYQLLPRHRSCPGRPQAASPAAHHVGHESESVMRDTVHALLTKTGDTYVVECLELAVVTQGKSIEEALANLQEAVALHLEGEDLGHFGLTHLRRIQILYDLPAHGAAA